MNRVTNGDFFEIAAFCKCKLRNHRDVIDRNLADTLTQFEKIPAETVSDCGTVFFSIRIACGSVKNASAVNMKLECLAVIAVSLTVHPTG